MIKSEQASLSVMRIAAITLIAIFSLSVCVLGKSMDVKNVKIVLSDNCEIDVLTTKSVVSDILEENHIVVLPEENVVPNLDSEITENSSKIVITGRTQDAHSVVAIAEEGESLGLDQLLSTYNTIIEKIVETEEEIPYETETNDDSNPDETTTTVVSREGENGVKKSVYKIKYQNDIEIDRSLINEEVIKEPINKIVHITNVTSRGSNSKTRTNTNAKTEDKKEEKKIEKPTSNGNALAERVKGIEPEIKTMNASAYSPSSTGSTRTASGATATAWYTIAAGKGYPMGTIMYVPYFKNQPNGGWFVVQDRGGAITNNKIDVFMNTHNECITFGRRNLECYVYVLD